MLATSGNEIKIWEIENFNLINEYSFQKSINWFCVKPDNSSIASILNNEVVNLINLQSHEIQPYRDIEAKCCCYESIGKYLAIGLINGNIDIYDFKPTSFRKKTHKIHTSSITSISWSKNDRYIASGCLNGSIMMLNTNTNQLSKPLFIANKTSSVTSLQYSAFGPTNLASSYDDGTIVYWDTIKEKSICVFNKHEAPATCCILSPINEILMLSGGLDNILACYDIRAKKHIKSTSVSGGITSLDMHKDGSTLAIGTANGNVQLHDLRSKFDEPFYSYQAHNTSLHCLKFLYEIKTTQNQKSDADITSTTTTTIMKRSNSINDNLNVKYNSQDASSNSRQILINKSNTFNNNTNGSQQTFINDTIMNNHHTKDISSASQLTFNIYSPECIRAESTQLNQQKQQEQKSTSSFILHKNSTSNNIDNLTPIANTSTTLTTTTSNPVTPTIPSTTNLIPKVNKSNLLHNTKNLNIMKVNSELYSPVVPPTNHDITQNYEKPTTIENISDYKVTLKLQGNNQQQTNEKHESKSQINITPLKPSTLLGTTTTSTVNTIKETISTNAAINISRALNNTSLLNNSIVNNNNNPNDSTIAGINAHATTLPIEQIKEIIKDSIDELKDEFMNENFKFKAELLKEFMLIKQEIHDSFKRCSVNDVLVNEIQRLKEENKRLKKLF